MGSPGARLPADVWPPASLGPQRSIHSAPTQGAQEASSVGVSTCAGGLLFLLPVLRDLGLPAFIASRPALAEGGFGLTVLREFARRARVPSDDPIWEMLALTNACIEAEPTFIEKAARVLEVLKLQVPECCRHHVIPLDSAESASDPAAA